MVHADCAGNWTVPKAEDPSSKSHCSFVITLGAVPVLRKSKQIQEICFSVMEIENINLSTAMRFWSVFVASSLELMESLVLMLEMRLLPISNATSLF